MPEYLCPKCKGFYCGWVVRYKYKQKCPNCGSELEEVYSNNKTGNKKVRRDPIVKLSKTGRI